MAGQFNGSTLLVGLGNADEVLVVLVVLAELADEVAKVLVGLAEGVAEALAVVAVEDPPLWFLDSRPPTSPPTKPPTSIKTAIMPIARATRGRRPHHRLVVCGAEY